MQEWKTFMMMRRWTPMTIALGLFVLITPSIYAQEEGPGTVCILQVLATGEVLATVVDDTQDIDIALVIPRDNFTNVPVRCQDIANERLGLAVANQEFFDVSLTARVYSNKGVLECTRGPFMLKVNGGRGIAFDNCL